ncbi:MAG: mechanosensitive ion channel [Erysipelotrichaceae bacterium]|nr:mechanosensitive ion channel [Erysipelotrichaceae bacterium]
MKENKKHLLVLIIALAVVLLSSGVGFITGMYETVDDVFKGITINPGVIVSLVSMVALVIGIQKILIIVLSFFSKLSKRINTLVTIFQSLVSYASFIVIICWGLSMCGVNVSTIIASVGIVALVVGFGAESLIEDVITGFFMLFENQYNVGDILEVDGFRGTVTSIGIRTTCITDMGGNIKIINNSDMKNILNRSDNASRAVSEIDIPYSTDMDEFESKLDEILKKIYEMHPDKFKNVPSYLGISEFKHSGVTIKFVVEVEEKDIYSAQRLLNRELFQEFKKIGVEIPFTQIDLHQK